MGVTIWSTLKRGDIQGAVRMSAVLQMVPGKTIGQLQCNRISRCLIVQNQSFNKAITGSVGHIFSRFLDREVHISVELSKNPFAIRRGSSSYGFQHPMSKLLCPCTFTVADQAIDCENIFAQRMKIKIRLYSQPTITGTKRQTIRILTKFPQIIFHYDKPLRGHLPSNCIF